MSRVAMIVWNEFLNDARVLKEAQTLQSAGYQVIVHALHTPGVTLEKETLTSGVQVIRVARRPLWKLRKKNRIWRNEKARQLASGRCKKASFSYYFLGLRLVVRFWTHLLLVIRLIKSRPDIIHAHDVNVLPTAWVSAIICRIPIIYDAHEISTDREGYSKFRCVVAKIEKYIMPKTAGNITTTDMRAKFFARAYRIPRPLVLQNRPLFSRVAKSDRIRQELKLDKKWPIVLYQGGLQQGRGLKKLIYTAVEIKNAYFVLIGGGRLAGELAEIAKNLSISDRVHFIPTVSLKELPSYTASADVGVQPIDNTCLNHFTTDSNKLFEYIMAGLPVIASNFPEIRKIVEPNNVGLLVESDNKSSLHDAIKFMVDNEEARKLYAENSYRLAKQLSWETQEQVLIRLYTRVLAGK